MGPRAREVTKITTEVWVRPGEHQTLEQLRERFKGRILRENDNGEILIALSEESPGGAS